MKYSLRSLMIVVTLAGVASGLVARSRYCSQQAALHRNDLVPIKELHDFQSQIDGMGVTGTARTNVERFIAREMCHHETAEAFEQVARMPFLPLWLPDDAPLRTPLLPPDCRLDDEDIHLSEELLAP